MGRLYRLLRIAIRALLRRPVRCVMASLGIAIGVAAVIAVMEVGQGSAQRVQEAIASLGASVVQVDPSALVKAGINSGSGGRVTLVVADALAIERECSAVRWAAPSVDLKGQVLYGRRNWAPQEVLGTTPEFLLVRNWDLIQGRCFTDDEVRAAAGVCLLGQTVVDHLFGDTSPLGERVRFRGVSLTVVGVLALKGGNMMGRDQDDYVICPFTTVKYRLGGSRMAAVASAGPSGGVNSLSALYPTQSLGLYPQPSAAQAADLPQMVRFSDLDDIFVSATAPADVPLAIEQIRALLRERHHLGPDAPDDFRIRDLTEISTQVASSGRLLAQLLLSVALISLVVGGVGVMNIMLASVTARTQEIGLRMAVGARARDVRRQFLTEAVVLCLGGGAAGVILGRGTSWILTAWLGWQTILSLPAVAVALAVSMGVGVIFGYYPAWKASRLDPIEALRHE